MFLSFILAAPLALAEDFQSKDDWRTKMLSEERVEKTLCHDKYAQPNSPVPKPVKKPS